MEKKKKGNMTLRPKEKENKINKETNQDGSVPGLPASTKKKKKRTIHICHG
jgi:hypothetical protein